VTVPRHRERHDFMDRVFPPVQVTVARASLREMFAYTTQRPDASVSLLHAGGEIVANTIVLRLETHGRKDNFRRRV
jgi:hypothetical protein